MNLNRYFAKKYVFSVLILLAGFLPLSAQLTINNAVTPATLVSNLIGAGLTVSNITMNCPAGDYGTFTNGSTTNLGINNGIMLATGNTSVAVGPNNIASAGTCAGTSFSDPQLVALEPQATYDPCILEFDIIPQCNTLTLSFVFGSEEYPEFVNSTYNDAFGFFITGPGPACQPGYYSNTNIATLPNSQIVSIDNVNNVTNTAYYVDNTGGATIQYDGFTTVLTRNVTLCPCQTYHFKIAIADAHDCLYDSGVFIDFMSCSTALSATTSSVPASGCSGCNGSATVTATGSNGPFTYSWSPGGYTTSTVNNLCAGTYTVTYDDAVSCSPAQTITVTVGSSGGGLTVLQTQGNVSCNGGCNGTANVNVTVGTAPYTYVWSPAPGGGQGTPNATGLCQGTYSCLITDNTGCTATQTFTITQPPVLTATTSSTPSSCGGNNGSVSVTGGGGAGGYTYLWTPGGYTTANVGSLPAGNYSVDVTDANGCTVTSTVNVANTGSMASTAAFTDIDCFGNANGTASVNVTGNSGTVSYVWSPNVSTTNSATNLPAGSYTVTATDAAGCITTQVISVTEPPQLTLNAGGFNVTCFGACDGQVVVLPTGGVPNYSFAWSSGCTTANCNNTCAGNYTVTVTDANGCSTTATTTVTEPADITIATSAVDAHCNQSDGSATANASGGTGTFTYNWLPSGTGATLNNIPAGSYSVIATDQNGCDDTVAVAVNNINGVNAVLSPVTDVSCFGLTDGAVAITASGGTGTYTYTWTPNVSAGNAASNLAAGAYQIVVTDAVGCTYTVNATVTQPPQLTLNASANPASVCNGQPVTLTAVPGGGNPGYTVNWNPGGPGTSITLTPTVSGTYTVDVTDQNGCTASNTVNVTVNDIPVAGFSGDVLAGCAPLCVNFTDASTITSGNISSWNWNFGDNATSSTQSPSHCYTTPGQYSVTLVIASSAGCSNTLTLTNYIDVFASPTAAFTASPQPATILNSQIYFTDHSTGASSWNWSFGDILNSTSNLQSPSFLYTDATCYDVVLAVSNTDGCVDTATENICIDPDVSIYVPNAFTPNVDNINEIFIPVCTGIDPEHYELWIFDRWGNLIFYSDDMNKGWDGKVQGGSDICQIDTYVWKVKAIDVLGKKHNLIGHVNLIR